MSIKEKIDLFIGQTRLVLSPFGGCLQKFSVNNLDILYPETLLEIKDQRKKRGGIPILFPWAGALEGLPQHGFARDLKWKKLPVHRDFIKKESLTRINS